jgi:hypothetical protein
VEEDGVGVGCVGVGVVLGASVVEEDFDVGLVVGVVEGAAVELDDELGMTGSVTTEAAVEAAARPISMPPIFRPAILPSMNVASATETADSPTTSRSTTVLKCMVTRHQIGDQKWRWLRCSSRREDR